MTAAIGAKAREAAGPTTTITAVNPVDGPASIESDEDEHRCVPGLLGEARKAAASQTPPEAYVIACFGDPGLDEVRAAVDVPVLGIAQSAMHAAALTAGSFSVLTSMSATVPRAWELAKSYTPNQCLGAYACDIPVLRIDSDSTTIDPIGDLCTTALAHDGSGTYWVAPQWPSSLHLSGRLGVPVVDGVVAATLLADALVGMRRLRR